MKKKQKQQLLIEMLQEYKQGYHEFPVVNDLSKIKKGFKGLALQINDHGNVTLWNCFKKGTVKEWASIV